MTSMSNFAKDVELVMVEPDLDRLRGAIKAEFLEDAGWDAAQHVFAPARNHPLLGLRECVVPGCIAGVRTPNADLCKTCNNNYNASGLPLGEFITLPVVKQKQRGETICSVPACPRTSHNAGGPCLAHMHHRAKHPEMTVAEWIAATSPTPYEAYGPCRVASCIRQAGSDTRLCRAHATRWRLAIVKGTVVPDDLGAWSVVEGPIDLDHLVIFKGLPERVILEILIGLQWRTANETRTLITVLRGVVKEARARRVESIFDMVDVPIKRARHDVQAMIRQFATAVRRTFATVETEYANDVWDLAVFGARGQVDFTGIRQPWLREAAKHWTNEDLPNHRGRQAAATSKTTVDCVQYLSESLHLNRVDRGVDHRELHRADIVQFKSRLAHLQDTEVISERMRVRISQRVRRFLSDVRAYGLADAGHPLEGLQNQFAMRSTDVPSEPKNDGPGRALPGRVLEIIDGNLHVLEARSGLETRRITELLIDTGRRPDEACRLPWDCLQENDDDTYTLKYTDFKNNRPNETLEIARETASLIQEQQRHVQSCFPDTSVADLVLFPRAYSNKTGTRSIQQDSYTDAHRKFINQIAHLLKTEDGSTFPAEAVTPYTYRHTFAQRYADGGTPPDVLSDLLGHEDYATTMVYYRVTQKRTRIAVDRIAKHQFDAQGNRVFKAVKGILEDEHARMRVGQIAVPFGVCTEPSNVKAGGNACPNKFICPGCDHFRSDASYLPELKNYLEQQLAERERILAASDLADWAKEKAAPAPQEIEELRALIRSIEEDFDGLTEDEQRLINEAVETLRETRKGVELGMPKIGRPPGAIV